MINMTDIQKCFYDIVNEATGVSVVWFNPNAPRARKPYLSLYILNFSSLGGDYEMPPDDNGMAALIGNRELTLQIQYYGSGGPETLEKLRTNMRSFPVQMRMQQTGISFVGQAMMENTMTLLDSSYEERYTMDLRFRLSNQGVGELSKYEVGLIESIQLHEQWQDEAGEVIIDQEHIISVHE